MSIPVISSYYNRLNFSANTLNNILPSILNFPSKRFKHYALLNNRGLIRIKGDDSTKFLHGIVTNNVEKNKENVLYADLLTNKGRVICDSFIYKIEKDNEEAPEYLLDVDKSLVPFLLKYLKRYKLRSDIHLFNASKNLNVWSVWKSDNETNENVQKDLENIGIITAKDPRCCAMGFRVVGKSLEDSDIFSKSIKQTEDDYKIKRILNGIPEGPFEIIKSSSFPFEANLDFLNGVDYHKGCYIGQELTYRTHKRGTIRKRLVPVQLYKEGESEPEKLAVNTQWEKTVVAPGTKLTPCQTEEAQNRIKNVFRDGIYNIGMALVNVDLFKQGEKKTTLFSINLNNDNNNNNNSKIYAKAFLPDFIDLTKKEENKTEN
ncbi:Aminomethyltransferase folate-binding domain-containing protein [Anaeromyces robustus]|uniref:Aminomethyltransferase folate-binding domain-containing protein n=1 Tax=Anaeromyces robustus TaxID=1754192 RepID=A0A1Y1WWC4_9FUNG|nr:Aminomethyltransferase folate-binding domain-containing protein [Anaeromyces robustus]|eukprot:ORX77859.1 Aminomethyltransferase folate-binding domain-containing protein [Anaeromyces robustus]